MTDTTATWRMAFTSNGVVGKRAKASRQRATPDMITITRRSRRS